MGGLLNIPLREWYDSFPGSHLIFSGTEPKPIPRDLEGLSLSLLMLYKNLQKELDEI
jgi:hypothetical protein